MKWLKRAGLIFTVMLIICLAVYNIPWMYKIDKTIQGVQTRIGNTDEEEKVTITVKGIYKRFLFKEDIFDGTIAVDKYDFTAYGSSLPYKFNNNFSVLSYINNIKGRPSHEFLGTIVCPPDFDQLLILVSEPVEGSSKSWTAENGLFISAPAENRSQAVDIAKTLSEKHVWSVNWR